MKNGLILGHQKIYLILKIKIMTGTILFITKKDKYLPIFKFMFKD